MAIDLRKWNDPEEQQDCGCLDVSEVLCIGAEIWWIQDGRVRNELIVRLRVERVGKGWKTITTYWTESGYKVQSGYASYEDLMDGLEKQRSAP